MVEKKPFQMEFEMSTIKHLGLQMYSTLPPVIGEIVANAWDANATTVDISIPETPIGADSEIVIADDGIGMSDLDVREKYLIVGRDRRDADNGDRTPGPRSRRIMGRKGIGKFSAFGIGKEIEIESVREKETSRFVMNYERMLQDAADHRANFPPLPPTGHISTGTMVTLRHLTKFRGRRIPMQPLRRRLARRFSVVGPEHGFEVAVNGRPITVEERDLLRLLEKDADGNPYIWKFDRCEIAPDTGWTVSGWIGSLRRTTPDADGVERGVSIMARGKMVQEPFTFDAGVGQQFALSYLVGELHAEFVDEEEDTIGTNRNTLVWDAEANISLRKWGKEQMARISREWAERRSRDTRRKVEQHDAYLEFKERATDAGNERAGQLADRLLRQAITRNPTAAVEEFEPVIKTCADFLEFSAFWEITQNLVEADVHDIGKLLALFREWQVVEAKEMARVTEGRVATIQRLQALIEENALEVPTLHNFLREFPWVIDPKWTLVADEVTYSRLLREQFAEPADRPEADRRIDFLCVRESTNLVVVEIKRPGRRVSDRDLGQIEEYVSFVRHRVKTTTDPDVRYESVVGYLLCGDVAASWKVTERVQNLAEAGIYVRKYRDLLERVRRMHKEFLERYEALRRIARARQP